MRIPLSVLDDLQNITTLTTSEIYYFYYFSIVAVYMFIVIFFMILPFYMHVFKKNRERDQNTPTFAVVEHYYGMVWKLGIGYVYFFVAFFYLINWSEIKGSRLLPIIAACTVLAGLIMCHLMDDVNQLMLSLLAIQRFFLYFFPNSEQFWSLSGKTIKSITWVTYGLVLVGWALGWLYSHNNYFIYYMFINTICIVSALLYIPIFWSIRKFAHLASAQLNRPQRYVLWQLVALALAKCIMIPAMYFVSEVGFFNTIAVCKLLNASLNPIVMQVTYLGCNRRNVQELWNTLRSRKFLVCCPCISTKVTPGGGQVNLELETIQQ